jgi:DNA modification methylase
MTEITLMQGDCLDKLKELDDNSVDSIVTDPPYGLSFMGKAWDKAVPSVEVWEECLRVLKPGGHLLSFAGTRTQHRMAVNIEDAGFEIRDMVAWVYGSGFPKSQNVSKAIDKASGRVGYATKYIKKTLKEAHDKSDMTLTQLNSKCGFEASGYLRESSTWANVLPPFDKWVVLRDAIGLSSDMDALFQEAEREVVGFQKRGNAVNTDFMSGGNDITAPATAAAKQWDGWGTALKPALEPITVARKPLTGTVAANVMEYGTGAINIDGCRVPGKKPEPTRGAGGQNGMYSPIGNQGRILDDGKGRFPANLIHDGSDEVVELFPITKSAGSKRSGGESDQHSSGGLFEMGNHTGNGMRYGDSGGSAARFFYCPKTSKKDRNEGLENIAPKNSTGDKGNGLSRVCSKCGISQRGSDECPDEQNCPKEWVNPPKKNNHPTVKPTELMKFLCRLVTPPGGTVLDPFMGSGSTGKAARQEGLDFIGIELDPEYIEIAKARIGSDNLSNFFDFE